MAIQYAGGSIVNTLFFGDTRQLIVTALQTHLTSAGWSVVSGGGTATVVMRSAATANGNSIDVKLRDTGAGNCARINMQNAALTKVSNDFFLLPAAAKQFRVIANKHQFFCYTPGSSAARDVVCGGTLYVPPFFSASVTGDLGWMHGSGALDSSTTISPTWRNSICFVAGGDHAMTAGLINGNLINRQMESGTAAACEQRAIAMVNSKSNEVSPQNCYRWHDDSLFVYEPLLGWGLANITDECKIRGQLWDSAILYDTFAGDTTITLDGGTFWAVTNSNAGTAGQARGTLFVKVA